MNDWLAPLRKRVMAWTTGAAATLSVAQLFSPQIMDFLLQFMIIGLVALASYLARQD